MVKGPFHGKGIKEGIIRVFFVGFIVPGLRSWGGMGRVWFSFFVFLGEIVVKGMGFRQRVAGDEGRGQVVSFSGHCV